MGVRVDLLETPRLEAAFKTVEIRPAFEELGQDDVYELFFVKDAKRSAGWEPGYGV